MSSEEKKASLSLVQSLLTLLPKGPFIFYEAGETGGIWGGGGSPKKNGVKGGAIPKKTEGRRGGGAGHAKYFSSCRVDMMFYY